MLGEALHRAVPGRGSGWRYRAAAAGAAPWPAARALQIGRGRRHRRRRHRGDVRRVGGAGERVLRERQHHRPRAPGAGGAPGPGHRLGNARGLVDLGDPLARLAEGAAAVDLLERLALALRARHLTRHQQQRRRALERQVQADGRVGGARAAGDHAGPGAAAGVGVGGGHEARAALLPAGDEARRVVGGAARRLVPRLERRSGSRPVHGVQGREVALARHSEHGVAAVGAQRVDQDPSAWTCHPFSCGGAPVEHRAAIAAAYRSTGARGGQSRRRPSTRAAADLQ